MKKNADLGRLGQTPEKSTLFRNSRTIKQSGRQLFQEPPLAKLAVFPVEKGKIRMQMAVCVFLAPDGNGGQTDEFQITFVAYESPRASKETAEYSLTISVKSLDELKPWCPKIIASIEAVCGDKDSLIAQKVNDVFEGFLEDKRSIEEKAAAAHGKCKNGTKK